MVLSGEVMWRGRLAGRRHHCGQCKHCNSDGEKGILIAGNQGVPRSQHKKPHTRDLLGGKNQEGGYLCLGENKSKLTQDTGLTVSWEQREAFQDVDWCDFTSRY